MVELKRKGDTLTRQEVLTAELLFDLSLLLHKLKLIDLDEVNRFDSEVDDRYFG